MECPSKPGFRPDSDQPDRKERLCRWRYRRRSVEIVPCGGKGQERSKDRRLDDSREAFSGHSGDTVGSMVVVLGVRQYIDMGRAAAVVVMVVVIRVMTVMMDGFA